MTATDFNETAAFKLRECARLLRQQGANPFRIGAYERAAQTLDELDEKPCTVVTDTHGLLTGERVVRGREHECLAHYADDSQTLSRRA